MQSREEQPGDRNSLCCLIGAIQIAGDLEYQRRIWVNDEGPDRSTFSEIVSQIFDDYRIDEMAGELGGTLGLSKGERDQLRTFQAGLDSYVESVAGRMDNDDLIVGDPQWQQVVTLAQETANRLHGWYDSNCNGSRRGA
jgi:hypothetical protein